MCTWMSLLGRPLGASGEEMLTAYQVSLREQISLTRQQSLWIASRGAFHSKKIMPPHSDTGILTGHGAG